MRFSLAYLSLAASLTACGGHVVATTGDGAAGATTTGGRTVQVASGASAERAAAGDNATAIACGQSPKALTVDATHVYWLNDHDVSRAPKNGGPATVLIDEKFTASGWGIAVDDKRVYWPGRGGVQSLSKDGQHHTILWPSTDVYDLAVDDTFVYFARPGMYSIPRDGGKMVTIGDDTEAIHVTLDGGYVYWSDWGRGLVQRAPVKGGNAETIVSGVPYANDLVVQDGVVYFSTGDHAFMRADAKPGSTATAVKDVYAYGVAADQSGVYAAGFNSGKVTHYSPASGAVTILASKQFYARAIAVDETHVYWTNDFGPGNLQGCIMKAAKPLAH